MSSERRVPRLGERPGTLRDLLEDGVEVEVFADPQDRLGQPGEASTKRLVLRPQAVTVAQPFTPLPEWSRPAGHGQDTSDDDPVQPGVGILAFTTCPHSCRICISNSFTHYACTRVSKPPQDPA